MITKVLVFGLTLPPWRGYAIRVKIAQGCGDDLGGRGIYKKKGPRNEIVRSLTALSGVYLHLAIVPGNQLH